VEEWANEHGVVFAKYRDTLREMAAIVAAVATGDEWVMESDFGVVCAWCEADADCVGVRETTHWEADHSPDCTYLRARRLMGLEP